MIEPEGPNPNEPFSETMGGSETGTFGNGLFAAGFDRRQGCEVWRELVGGESLDIHSEQAGGWNAELKCAVRSIDHHGDTDDLGSEVFCDGDRLLDPPPLGDDILDHEDFLERSKTESPAQDEMALLFFGEDEAYSQLPGHFLPDNQATHGGCDDGDSAQGSDFVCKRRAESFHGWHVLQGEGALEELAAAQAAAEDEMAFEQGTGFAENVEDFGGRHVRRVKQHRPL